MICRCYDLEKKNIGFILQKGGKVLENVEKRGGGGQSIMGMERNYGGGGGGGSGLRSANLQGDVTNTPKTDTH